MKEQPIEFGTGLSSQYQWGKVEALIEAVITS
jgi:hypothetical protein